MSSKKVMLALFIFVIAFSSGVAVTTPERCYAAKKRITLGGGSPGAIYYLFSAAVARLINKHFPDEFIAKSVSVGGSAQNAILLSKKDQEFAPVANDVAYHAYNGKQEFTGKACPNLRSVTGGYSYAMNLIVLDGSPIRSYRDIVGRKVATGPAGGSYYTHVERIMSLGYGVDINKQIKQVHGNYNAQCDFLKDGTVDAIFNPSGIIPETRGGGTYNLAVLRKVRFISIDEDAIKKIRAKFPYFVPAVIEPGFFPNQNKRYRLLAVPAIVCSHKDVSADVVYKITKLMYENKSELAEILPAAKDFVDPSKIKSLSIPLHPGALKYYREKGIETPKF